MNNINYVGLKVMIFFGSGISHDRIFVQPYLSRLYTLMFALKKLIKDDEAQK